MLVYIQMNTNIPNKGDVIISPKTNRPIRVGSRTWLSLVKEGLIQGTYNDPKELAMTRHEDVEEQIDDINKTLPRGVQAVRGRGKHKGKLVKRNQQPKTEDVFIHTAKMASRVMAENIEALSESDNLEEELERLILQEITMNSRSNRVSKPTPKSNRKQIDQAYELEECQLYDDEEDEDEDDGDFDTEEEEY
jgi:hypothetical protein